MAKPYINYTASHQRDQAPTVYAIRSDGCFLDTDYRVRTVSFVDFRESYQGWLASMLVLARKRQTSNSTRHLNGGKHGL